mgnify:CR=1 FL=1
MDFLKDIAKTAGNEYASLVADGVEAGDVDAFIDTGSYIFNALLSGSIYGGLAANKITAVAGESATGKTFFVMGMVKSFLDSNPRSATVVALEDSEVLVIPHKKFMHAMDGQARWMQTLMKTLSLRLRNANEMLSSNSHPNENKESLE